MVAADVPELRVPTIRPYDAGDEAALYDICLRTGADGADARSLYTDPRLLGSVYVGPYLALEPDLAFVLADGDRVLGYVLGALDTAAFDLACELRWWPRLRRQHPLGTGPVDASATGPADRELVALLREPARPDPDVLVGHPSHLHIDLLPEAQGSGGGRRLIDHLLAALSARGSRGVHLGVARSNARAIGFYRHLGFVELTADERGSTMGRPLRRDDA